ncbi:MAG: hypothetical protein ACYS0E_03180 [Planctomycetota bacterium]|jgi:hypothetical protein
MPENEPAGDEFSLILLDVGEEVGRIVRATIRVRRCDPDEAIGVLRAPLPIRIVAGLTPQAAQEAQWEFVSCDCIAVYVRDEIVDEGGSTYLKSLFQTVRKSPEFTPVEVEVESVPDSEPGKRYLDQFFGSKTPDLPHRVQVREKKARLMEFFGEKVGAVVRRC